jgi:hypothetical protein
MNKGVFRYIDMDKILPYLAERERELIEKSFNEDCAVVLSSPRRLTQERALELADLRHKIERGFFSWQPGSE